MNVYRDFAYLYMKGDYPHFSERMATLLPPILKKFGATPRTVLDVACGEGSFAAAMAGRGYSVTGVDCSASMLKIARERAAEAGHEIEFLEQDMRALSVEAKYDLATSWFDSLNYLLKMEDLKACYSGVHKALSPGGLFAFDMNTVYGLGVIWQKRPCEVCQDTDEFFEIHRKSYDFETNIAVMRITGFMKINDTWVRVDEEHQERGYTLGEIHSNLRDCGFDILATWDNPEAMSEPKPESGRIWVVARKPA
jgi:ubiquinone/menaquinone biosynthesis C-methylase UbiE